MLRYVAGTILPTGIVSSLRGGNQTIPTLLCWLSSSCHSLSAAATVWVRTWPCLSSRWCSLPPSPLRSIRSFLTLSPYCLLPRLPPAFSYTPPPPSAFQAGVANWLGRSGLALLVCLIARLRQVLAPLVQRFSFELVDPEVKSEHFLTFKPKDVQLRVKAR